MRPHLVCSAVSHHRRQCTYCSALKEWQGVPNDIYSLHFQSFSCEMFHNFSCRIDQKVFGRESKKKKSRSCSKFVRRPDADVDLEVVFLLRDGARHHNTTTTTAPRQPIHKPQVQVLQTASCRETQLTRREIITSVEIRQQLEQFQFLPQSPLTVLTYHNSHSVREIPIN